MHLEVDIDDLPEDYVSVQIDVPDNLKVHACDAQIDLYDITETRAHGDQWLTSAWTAVFDVPSAVVPQERNLCLNPGHPDFLHIKTMEIAPFQFDPRLFASG